LYQREEFEPVSIKMAKEQNLNLNSMKISGMCGRLLCCLGFEYDVYKELNEKMPEVESIITAGDKQFRVVSVNTLKEAVVIKDGDRFLEIGTAGLILNNGKYSIKDELIEELFKSDDDSDK
jgi:cell fate regulator YaaT (PSP1 superfamily)